MEVVVEKKSLQLPTVNVDVDDAVTGDSYSAIRLSNSGVEVFDEMTESIRAVLLEEKMHTTMAHMHTNLDLLLDGTFGDVQPIEVHKATGPYAYHLFDESTLRFQEEVMNEQLTNPGGINFNNITLFDPGGNSDDGRKNVMKSEACSDLCIWFDELTEVFPTALFNEQVNEHYAHYLFDECPKPFLDEQSDRIGRGVDNGGVVLPIMDLQSVLNSMDEITINGWCKGSTKAMSGNSASIMQSVWGKTVMIHHAHKVFDRMTDPSPIFDDNMWLNELLMLIFDPGGFSRPYRGCDLLVYNGTHGDFLFTTNVVDAPEYIYYAFDEDSTSHSSKDVSTLGLALGIPSMVFVRLAFDEFCEQKQAFIMLMNSQQVLLHDMDKYNAVVMAVFHLFPFSHPRDVITTSINIFISWKVAHHWGKCFMEDMAYKVFEEIPKMALTEAATYMPKPALTEVASYMTINEEFDVHCVLNSKTATTFDKVLGNSEDEALKLLNKSSGVVFTWKFERIYPSKNGRVAVVYHVFDDLSSSLPMKINHLSDGLNMFNEMSNQMFDPGGSSLQYMRYTTKHSLDQCKVRHGYDSISSALHECELWEISLKWLKISRQKYYHQSIVAMPELIVVEHTKGSGGLQSCELRYEADDAPEVFIFPFDMINVKLVYEWPLREFVTTLHSAALICEENKIHRSINPWICRVSSWYEHNAIGFCGKQHSRSMMQQSGSQQSSLMGCSKIGCNFFDEMSKPVSVDLQDNVYGTGADLIGILAHSVTSHPFAHVDVIGLKTCIGVCVCIAYWKVTKACNPQMQALIAQISWLWVEEVLNKDDVGLTLAINILLEILKKGTQIVLMFTWHTKVNGQKMVVLAGANILNNFVWDPGHNAMFFYILEDKDVFERVGKRMILMDHTSGLTVTTTMFTNPGKYHFRLQAAGDLAFAIDRSLHFQLGYVFVTTPIKVMLLNSNWLRVGKFHLSVSTKVESFIWNPGIFGFPCSYVTLSWCPKCI